MISDAKNPSISTQLNTVLIINYGHVNTLYKKGKIFSYATIFNSLKLSLSNNLLYLSVSAKRKTNIISVNFIGNLTQQNVLMQIAIQKASL